MRLLAFAPLPPPATGQSRVTAHVLASLEPLADIQVVNTADPGLVWRAPGRLPLGHALRWLRSLVALRRALRTFRPDRVYLTPASSALGLLRDVCSVALVPRGVPIIAHVHVGDYGALLAHPRLGPVARAVARRFARMVMPSAFGAAGVAERVGVPVHVVPNAVPADVRVTDAEVEAKWTRPRRDPPHIAFVAHLLPSKGYLVLADAAARLESQGAALRLTFAGAWPSEAERRAFEARLADEGRAGRWRVAGVLPPHEIRALLLDADVFAFPSTYPHESLSLATLEAMQAGCAVAAVRHAAIEELVRDGVEGGLATLPTPGEFAHVLGRVLADAERFGRAAALRARTAFAAETAHAAMVRAVLT